jgi:hypothetical protein
VVVKQTIPEISHTKGMEEYIPFDLNAKNLNEKIDYTIRVHISLHDSEEVVVGDCITTESYPISPTDDPAPITVKVQEVK